MICRYIFFCSLMEPFKIIDSKRRSLSVGVSTTSGKETKEKTEISKRRILYSKPPDTVCVVLIVAVVIHGERELVYKS